MAAPFTTNIQMSVGMDFSQDFYLTNPDKSPMNITGCSFSGSMAKWPGSFDAVVSTSEEMVYNYIPFTGSVSNGTGGVYNLSMNGESTIGMEQGKYVYSVVMTDVNGTRNNILNGLVFLDFCVHQ